MGKNMCLCSGSSWGWMADDPVSDFDWLIRMLVNVVCRDGNLLLNIGPDRNGKVSEEIHQRIRQIGDWLSRCGESIYNTRGGPFEPEDEVYGTTFRENRIYLHILDTAAYAGRRLPDPACGSDAVTCWEQKKTRLLNREKKGSVSHYLRE